MEKPETEAVEFVEAVTVKDHAGAVVFSAKAGEVKELNPASAARWYRRNKAKPAPVKAKSAPKKKAATGNAKTK